MAGFISSYCLLFVWILLFRCGFVYGRRASRFTQEYLVACMAYFNVSFPAGISRDRFIVLRCFVLRTLRFHGLLAVVKGKGSRF